MFCALPHPPPLSIIYVTVTTDPGVSLFAAWHVAPDGTAKGMRKAGRHFCGAKGEDTTLTGPLEAGVNASIRYI